MRTKMKIMGLRGSTIKPLNEVAAAELGAELLGETIVFLIGGGCMVLEYTRQSANSRRKEEELNETIVSLQTEIAELKLTTETLDAQLREFNRVLHSFPAPPKKWSNQILYLKYPIVLYLNLSAVGHNHFSALWHMLVI